MKVLLLVLAATAAFGRALCLLALNVNGMPYHFAAAPLTAPIACTKSEIYEITDTATSIGCTSYIDNMNVTWILKGDVARVLDFSYLNTETTHDYVEVFYEGKSYGRFSGKERPEKQLSFGPGDIRVTFKTDGSVVWVGFTLDVFPRPSLHQLVSAQPYTVQSRQDGGFVYFGLPSTSRGRLFQLHVTISYEGLKPPGCFVFVDGFPTLEHYHYTNATEQTGAVYTCTISVAQPRAGAWTTGVFLYGTAAKMTVTSTWSYELPTLQPTHLYNGTSTAAEPHHTYQIFVPVGVSALKFQLSREAPGGYPVAYIAQGFLPTPDRYQYQMDTRKSSYVSLPIPNPNPHGSSAPNPGNYIVLILPVEGSTAGYLIRADW